MKKIILLALIALMTCTRGAGQNMFSGSTDLEVIANEWENVTLTGVANGSLVSMLDCFNQKWPTWMLNAAIQTMKKGVDGRDAYNDNQIVVHNKPKNGFVQVDWWGNAERHEFMRACYWKRSNGNRLFGIYFGGTDNYPNIHFVCVYNYDMKKHTLTPEPQIIDGFRTTEDTKYYYDLPEEGKEFRISEFGTRGHYIHTFKWDGMKPVYSQSEKIEDDIDCEHNDEEEE
ncbi:MAG: hypothetical protein J5543_02145 [Bacteroidales bacterium]|nr:hypothetical protein [Bacteroidales bacterium]